MRDRAYLNILLNQSLSLAFAEANHLNDLFLDISGAMNKNPVFSDKETSSTMNYLLDDIECFQEELRADIYDLYGNFIHDDLTLDEVALEEMHAECEQLRNKFQDKHTEIMDTLNEIFLSYLDKNRMRTYLHLICDYGKKILRTNEKIKHTIVPKAIKYIDDYGADIVSIFAKVKMFMKVANPKYKELEQYKWDDLQNKYVEDYVKQLKMFRGFILEQIKPEKYISTAQQYSLIILQNGNIHKQAKKINPRSIYAQPRTEDQFVLEFLMNHKEFFMDAFMDSKFQSWCEQKENKEFASLLSAGLKYCFGNSADVINGFFDRLQNRNTMGLFLCHQVNEQLVFFLKAMIEYHDLAKHCEKWQQFKQPVLRVAM